MKHAVASTGHKEHKSEVFGALASSLAEENYLLARTLDGCKHAGSDRGHQTFLFLVVMRVQCIQWNLATCVGGKGGHGRKSRKPGRQSANQERLSAAWGTGGRVHQGGSVSVGEMCWMACTAADELEDELEDELDELEDELAWRQARLGGGRTCSSGRLRFCGRDELGGM